MSMVALAAPPEILLPRANSMVAPMKGPRRPRAFASCSVRGYSTAHATMNELVIQTYCDPPPTESVILGRAVVMIPTSNAEMTERIHRAESVPQKRSERRCVVAAGKLVSFRGSPSGSASTTTADEDSIIESTAILPDTIRRTRGQKGKREEKNQIEVDRKVQSKNARQPDFAALDFKS
jgi:hypothetical protein